MDKKSYWRKHNDNWEKSDLTQQEYCTLHQLRDNQFGYWRHKFSQQSKRSAIDKTPPQFIQLSVEANNSASSDRYASNEAALTVQFNQLHLVFTQQSDPLWLTEVISSLSKVVRL